VDATGQVSYPVMVFSDNGVLLQVSISRELLVITAVCRAVAMEQP
jgi:hypothetical protein